ncbi:MAG: hypothetical protein IPM46_02050 [Flavobacteriales bacterium]|nr:hypothetical protein [Flavobacteriales bacterium]
MSNDKGFRPMNALVESLRKAEDGLRIGTLGAEDLDQATVDARELYERLVVLRHKSRENLRGKAKEPAESSEPKATVTQPAAAPAMAPPPPPVPAPKPAESTIRLDTRPQDPRQTSLVEAIADEAEPEPPVMRTAAEYLKEAAAATATKAKAPETLAQKLEKARIPDLSKAISLSHKFWFTAELFGGDGKAYEQGIGKLNGAKDVKEAQTILESDVLATLKKPADPEAVETFTELLQRRFS